MGLGVDAKRGIEALFVILALGLKPRQNVRINVDGDGHWPTGARNVAFSKKALDSGGMSDVSIASSPMTPIRSQSVLEDSFIFRAFMRKRFSERNDTQSVLVAFDVDNHHDERFQ